MSLLNNVDRSQSDAMNLQVLRRQDDRIMEIVGMASHVVMYEFDQTNQNWKRKDVEGCLFVVKRYSAPRFQVFINNRLSTTNMAIPVDESLQVDSVDTFLIFRCADASYPTGYAIYGAWFYPEEDRDKTLALLQRVLEATKNPQVSRQPPPPPSQQPPQSKQQQQQQQQQQSKQQKQSSFLQATTVPSVVLPRQPIPSQYVSNGSSSVHLSKDDGKAAGNAILGMISNRPSTENSNPTSGGVCPQLLIPTAVSTRNHRSTSTGSSSGRSLLTPFVAAGQSQVSKEHLKQTLISLLDDSTFFDQVYHAYVQRIQQQQQQQ